MSGGYTHITLAQLAIEELRNRREDLLQNDAKRVLGDWERFCIVAHCRYFNVLDCNSSAWADKGHLVALLRNGVAKKRGIAMDKARPKCMAWLFGLTRDGDANHGLVYPTFPQPQYIHGRNAPGGIIMDFEELFRKAFNNIVQLWGGLALSLQNRESPLDTLTNWSLDAGIDKSNRMIDWN